MAFDSYIKNGSSTVLPTHFFMTLVKCKNPSDKFPCGDDFDVMSFILPHVDTIPNCLVSVSFFRKTDLVFVDICFIYFFPFYGENNILFHQKYCLHSLSRQRRNILQTMWLEFVTLSCWQDSSCSPHTTPPLGPDYPPSFLWACGRHWVKSGLTLNVDPPQQRLATLSKWNIVQTAHYFTCVI